METLINTKNEKEEETMGGTLKAMLLILMVIYIISPVDLCPGPIDDAIVLLLGLGLSRSNKLIE